MLLNIDFNLQVIVYANFFKGKFGINLNHHILYREFENISNKSWDTIVTVILCSNFIFDIIGVSLIIERAVFGNVLDVL